MPSPDPIVSVIMANLNGERFLADALKSACSQTLQNIEIILIDDASSDASLEIAHTFARQDSRIRIVARQTRSGPGSARNEGLAAARGQWIAVLDSDDIIHPSRLEHLVTEAENSGADIVADDLLIFQDSEAPATLLSSRQRKLGWLSAADFISSNKLLSREPALGYLKPLIRTAFLRDHSISYRPDLPIGEDYDLVVQLLAKGAKFRLLDSLGYFYRKHSQSISHRMSGQNVAQMLAADAHLRALFPADATGVGRAFDERRASIERAAAYSDIVAALKAGNWREAGATAIRSPRAIPLLLMPIFARVRRLRARFANAAAGNDEKRVCLISRQRLIGNTNGSSTYVLALARALRDSGHKITLISPSGATFGRWPFLRLLPEMSVFDEIHVRRAWRLGGRLYVAKDPRIALAAVMAVFARTARRFGLEISSWDRPAAYAIATPWRRNDLLYIAAQAPRTTRLILADYAFTTPAIPYVLAPSATSAVVMHDFFSMRAERFREQQLADSVTALDQATEMQLLRQADAIIAIQDLEAKEVQRLLPDRRVLLAPLACHMAAKPQTGDRRTVLFVGSNTAPNVLGLEWLFSAVWPQVVKQVPGCRLLVAGSVRAAFRDHIPGVEFLGIVANLDDVYAQAGVVISPLTVGSGLKIKLVEALGQGKAIVATSVTTEGCTEAVRAAIFEHDDARAFSNAIVQLLVDDKLRSKMATAALEAARRHYSPEACYGNLLAFANSACAPGQRTEMPSTALTPS